MLLDNYQFLCLLWYFLLLFFYMAKGHTPLLPTGLEIQSAKCKSKRVTNTKVTSRLLSLLILFPFCLLLQSNHDPITLGLLRVCVCVCTCDSFYSLKTIKTQSDKYNEGHEVCWEMSTCWTEGKNQQRKLMAIGWFSFFKCAPKTQKSLPLIFYWLTKPRFMNSQVRVHQDKVYPLVKCLFPHQVNFIGIRPECRFIMQKSLSYCYSNRSKIVNWD